MKTSAFNRMFPLSAVITAILLCTPIPLSQDDEGNGISLSLEKDGRTQAKFSGEPIKAIVELDKPVKFSELAWHTGTGIYSVADSFLDTQRTRFEVFLKWKALPLNKDTVNNCSFDTLYISIGGNVKVSNTVRVDVVNIAPVLDSIKINTISYSGQESSFRYSVNDTAGSVLIRIYTIDIDGKQPMIAFNGDGGRIEQNIQNAMLLSYAVPEGDFKDTVILTIYDGEGGQVIKPVYLSRVTPNTSPVIDSIVIRNYRFKTSAAMYQASFTAFDTLRCVVYAHDQDKGDALSYSWSNSGTATVKNETSSAAYYVCTSKTCTDTTDGEAIIVDTIQIIVSDKSGDSVWKYIQIMKGRMNTPPVIDSIRFGDSLYQGEDTSFTGTFEGPKSYKVSLFAHDPEKDRIRTTWIAGKSSRLSLKTDSSVTYTSDDSIYNDTLRIRITDSSYTTTKNIIIQVKSRILTFDSLTVNDSTYKKADSIYSHEAVLRDTLRFELFSRYKGSRDSVKYSWNSRIPSAITAFTYKAVYPLSSQPITDTIRVVASTGLVQFTKRIVMRSVSHNPVIDSITVGATSGPATFTGTLPMYKDTLKTNETATIQVFTHDLDKREALNCTWTCRDTSMIDKIASDGTIIKYTAFKTPAIDTLTVQVKDLKLSIVQKKIEFTIK